MLLALHPEEQQAVQAEVDAVLDVEGKLGYEDLDRLVLCQGTMNESLRLFPPVVLVPKVAVQDGVEIASAKVLCVCGRLWGFSSICDDDVSKLNHRSMHAQGQRFRIPEGAIVSLNVYALHRNPKHYPDPEAFRCVSARALSSEIKSAYPIAGDGLCSLAPLALTSPRRMDINQACAMGY